MKAEKGQILLAFVIMGVLWVLCMAVGAAGPKEPLYSAWNVLLLLSAGGVAAVVWGNRRRQ